MPGGRLDQVRNWVVYYGTDQRTPLERYDLAVVAPEAWDSASIQAKQAAGTKMIAYLSVLEVPLRPSAPPPIEVLKIDGRPVEQTRWSNWILDPRQAGTAERLLRLGVDLCGLGFDGLFLDTLGDVESGLIPLRLRTSLLPAAGRLAAALRRRLPQAILIQNWGLGAVLELTLPYLDGVCWEDYPLGPPQLWQEELAGRLRGIARGGTRVFALGHQDLPEARAAATEQGFCWYGAPGSYTAYHAEGGE